ncbi:MAG TPA: DNA polymerase IV [Chloroflexota bacterium]|nr:DNA polymerase IV [Chloroflexota bacterium]
MAERWILHIDLDAMFAAVEVLQDPALAGKPVIVGASPGRRGVVSTCSYEARAFGVHSAMPIGEAYSRCPQGVFLPVRHGLYKEYSHRVFDLVSRYADAVQQISIDEAFVDLSFSSDPEAVSREIKGRIHREIGLVASVGLASNKLVAKIATDFGKPDGFVVVPHGQEAVFLAPMPVGRLWGVGPKTAQRLETGGIRTAGDLAAANPSTLAGIVGARQVRPLVDRALGVDDSPVKTDRELKSISEEETFQRDESDRRVLWKLLLSQAAQCAARLRDNGLLAHTVTVKLRFGDFRTTTRALTLTVMTDDADAISEAAAALMRRWWAPESRPLRLLGLRVSGLEAAAGLRQLPLPTFDHLITTGVPTDAQSQNHLASSKFSPRQP